MVSLCISPTRKVPCLMRKKGLQQLQSEMPAFCRLGHSQSLWEDLLGRKIEASAAKKLEDAFLEYKVRKAVPSWLPFFPHCSFWIPSNEYTIKHLQVLAQRIPESRVHAKDRPRAGKSMSQSSDDDKNGAISTATAWSLILHTDRLLSHVEPPALETAYQCPTTAGTILGPVVDIFDDNDGDNVGEVEAIAKKKVKGG